MPPLLVFKVQIGLSTSLTLLNRTLQNQKLIFSFKFPFNLAAEPRSGEAETLTYPKVWSILEKVRTHFQENPADDF